MMKGTNQSRQTETDKRSSDTDRNGKNGGRKLIVVKKKEEKGQKRQENNTEQ